MKREKAKTFQDLIVWQKAHNFVLSVYKVTEIFPKKESEFGQKFEIFTGGRLDSTCGYIIDLN